MKNREQSGGVSFTFNINGNTESADGFEDEREWARSYWAALSPFHTKRLREFPNGGRRGAVRLAY